MHLSSGHVTLMPGKFYPPPNFPQISSVFYNSMKHLLIIIIIDMQHMKKLDVNDRTFAYLTSLLLQQYFLKC